MATTGAAVAFLARDSREKLQALEADGENALDAGDLGAFGAGGESGGGAAGAGAASAADAVDEVLGNLRKIVIDHVGDPFDVNAAGGHIGGHQDAILAFLESAQRLVALVLAAVAVNGRGLDAARAQFLGEAVGAVLGAGEDQERAFFLPA